MMTDLMRSVSGMALAAATSLVATTTLAADLGGNCCADLEERVAELEATAVRKGNRKVSLQIYGQVSEAIIWWNDGAESNVYVQEMMGAQNRLGFTGTAKINNDWSAGFRLELQIRALPVEFRQPALARRQQQRPDCGLQHAVGCAPTCSLVFEVGHLRHDLSRP